MAASINSLANVRLNTIINVLRYSSKEKWIPKCYCFKKNLRLDQKTISKRSFSSTSSNLSTEQDVEKNTNCATSFQVFDEMIDFRRRQAASSIMVETSLSNSSAVQNICSSYGKIEKVIHLLHQEKEWILLEFDSSNSVKNLFKDCSDILAVSPFFKMKGNSSLKDMNHEIVQVSSSFPEQQLLHARSISEQMRIYYQNMSLTDVEQRFRWITCYQVEQIFSRIFPYIEIYPFGSSVNGCGRTGSDLDLVASLTKRGITSSLSKRSLVPLVFPTRSSNVSNKAQIVHYLGICSEALKLSATGCTEIRRILGAKVPIIKFNHKFTGLECDLSMGSLSGVYMSELLFLFGEMDERFRPLVATVRYWASETGLTRPIPGHTITNFTLTLLIICYLQRLNIPILPTFDEMIQLARPEDNRVTYDLDCTFHRDPSIFKKRFNNQNNDSLEKLLIGFLRFIETFDYSKQALTIVKRDLQTKPCQDHLYMQNPLEREHNVSKNVSFDQLKRLKLEAGKAQITLQETSDQNRWGLLSFGKDTLHHGLDQKPLSTAKLLHDIFKPAVTGKPRKQSTNRKGR